MKYVILFFTTVLFLLSCTENKSAEKNVIISDSLNIVYAKGFKVNYFPDYKEVVVFSPWVKNTVYARYYLVKNEDILTPDDGIKVTTPLKSIAATSVTHFEFLHLLNELQTVNGVCSPKIIYNQLINTRLSKGEIVDLGDAFNINVEKTLQLHPSAVMMSGYNQNDPYAQRVSQAGIPVLFNNEWMETNLLARAEWIKFVSVFYDKEKLADSIFNTIDKRYNEIKTKAARVKIKPKVMVGSNFRGTWYVPSGRNFMGRLLADAGSEYFYQNDTTGGSLPLNTETILKNFSNSDYWLNCNFPTIKALIQADAKHALFRPVRLRKVFNFNKRLLPSTANDFWESAVAHPDLLLSDVIFVLHPEILPGYNTVYLEQLK